ncbi:hypothetical protein HOA91_05540 [Candidatus Woesearchaeota archaeon]|jgi:hypothetical protein|nr:hypothetical protein [Candidatus Woesearchaeota archaeon]
MKRILILTMLVSALFLVSCNKETVDPSLDEFATCLTTAGAEMYGLYNCGHCKDQKEMFGSSFNKINYIECSVDQKKCAERNIKGVPIWFFADDSSLSGVQSFVNLAKKTGCPLP